MRKRTEAKIADIDEKMKTSRAVRKAFEKLAAAYLDQSLGRRTISSSHTRIVSSGIFTGFKRVTR